MSTIVQCIDSKNAEFTSNIPTQDANNPYGDFETIPVLLNNNNEQIASIKLPAFYANQTHTNHFIFESALQNIFINSVKETNNACGDSLTSNGSKELMVDYSFIEKNSQCDEAKCASIKSFSLRNSIKSANEKNSVSLKHESESKSSSLNTNGAENKEIEHDAVSSELAPSDSKSKSNAAAQEDTIDKIQKLSFEINSFLIDSHSNANYLEDIEKEYREYNKIEDINTKVDDVELATEMAEVSVNINQELAKPIERENISTESISTVISLDKKYEIKENKTINSYSTRSSFHSDYPEIQFKNNYELELNKSECLVNKYCRNNVYPNTDIKRFKVPDDKIDFNVPYTEYNSVVFPFFDISMEKILINSSQQSNESIKSSAMVHRNPKGRTGLIGKGFFSVYGPNKCAFTAVTKYKHNEITGEIEYNKTSNKPLSQVLLIQREDYLNKWAIPGGSRDNDLFFNVLIQNGENSTNAEMLQELSEALFNEPSLVYNDYLDDYFNTDYSWLHAIVEHYHHKQDEVPARLNELLNDSSFNPEKIKLEWFDFDNEDIYEPHKKILKIIEHFLDAHYIS